MLSQSAPDMSVTRPSCSKNLLGTWNIASIGPPSGVQATWRVPASRQTNSPAAARQSAGSRSGPCGHAKHYVASASRRWRQQPYLSLNPYGRVPTLEEDGFVLFELTAILNYLEANTAGRVPDCECACIHLPQDVRDLDIDVERIENQSAVA